MKLIPLTKGLFAKVDDEDYEYLMQFKWHATEVKLTHGSSNFYARRVVKRVNKGDKNKNLMMHREILNSPKEMLVDHKDHDTLNNQKNNIRICTSQQNQCNSTATGKSKYVGVAYNKKKNKYNKEYEYWRATIHINGKPKNIGIFDYNEKGEIEAAKEYDKYAKIYYGEFANLNFK